MDLVGFMNQAVKGHDQSCDRAMLMNRFNSVLGTGGVTRAPVPVYRADVNLKKPDKPLSDPLTRGNSFFLASPSPCGEDFLLLGLRQLPFSSHPVFLPGIQKNEEE